MTSQSAETQIDDEDTQLFGSLGDDNTDVEHGEGITALGTQLFGSLGDDNSGRNNAEGGDGAGNTEEPLAEGTARSRSPHRRTEPTFGGVALGSPLDDLQKLLQLGQLTHPQTRELLKNFSTKYLEEYGRKAIATASLAKVAVCRLKILRSLLQEHIATDEECRHCDEVARMGVDAMEAQMERVQRVCQLDIDDFNQCPVSVIALHLGVEPAHSAQRTARVSSLV